MTRAPSLRAHDALPLPPSQPGSVQSAIGEARSTTPLTICLGQSSLDTESKSTPKPRRVPWVKTPRPQARGVCFSESSEASLASAQPGSKNWAPLPRASTWPSPSSSLPLEHCGAPLSLGVGPEAGGAEGACAGAGAGAGVAGGPAGSAPAGLGSSLGDGALSPTSPSSAVPSALTAPPHRRAAATWPNVRSSAADGAPGPRRSAWDRALAAAPDEHVGATAALKAAGG